MDHDPIAAEAARRVLGEGRDLAAINPVYRGLAASEDPGRPAPAGAPGSAGAEAPSEDLAAAVAMITAPAVLVLASASPTVSRALRVGMTGADDGTVIVEEPSEQGSRWTRTSVDELPQQLASILPVGPLAASPRLTQESSGDVLRLDAAQAEELASQVRSGVEVDRAIRRLDGLDPRLLDALTSNSYRASVALVMNPGALGRPGEPIVFDRLWTVGKRGLYRLDASSIPVPAIVPVAPGDVMGTVLPLLDQGLAFAAGRSPEEAMTR